MPRSSRPALAAALALLAAAPAAGQTPYAVAPVAAAPEARSTAALVGGGLLGGAVGLVGGFYLGAALADSDGEDLDFLSGGVAGAAIGEGILLPLGVHVANGRRGDALVSSAVSLGIAAAGLLALEAAHYDPPWAPAIAVAVPVTQLVASIAIERGASD